ncbi:hypothetical protein D3C72_2089640 [compost metagenome]
MARIVLQIAPELAESDIYVGDERDMVHRISDYVRAQATRLLELAPQVPKVDPRLFRYPTLSPRPGNAGAARPVSARCC